MCVCVCFHLQRITTVYPMIYICVGKSIKVQVAEKMRVATIFRVVKLLLDKLASKQIKRMDFLEDCV